MSTYFCHFYLASGTMGLFSVRGISVLIHTQPALRYVEDRPRAQVTRVHGDLFRQEAA